MAQHREQALATGCCGYLAKPVRLQSLLAEVAAILDRQSIGAH
jgi:DNA-binding response OmpR family regulator